MKHFYSLLLIPVITISLHAQITLTSATSIPNVGDSFSYIIIPDYTLDVSQSGANITWDFSSVSGTTETANYIDLASSSEPSTYPSANLVGVVQTAETYFSTSNSEMAVEGNYAPGIGKDIYTDKREFLKFPITYNDTFNETFEGTVENTLNQIYNRSGTITITADGHGTLILPYTTVYNVIRIKIISTYSDLYMGTPIGTYEDTIYVWYNLNNKTHLASTTDLIINGFPTVSQATYIAQSDLILGTNAPNLAKSQITIYPNPSKGHTVLNNKTTDDLSISIYDAKGVLVTNLDLGIGETDIDTSNFQSGIYILKATTNKGISTHRLIVK